MVTTQSATRRDARLFDLAARQRRVVATRQLRDLGFHTDAIAHRVRGGLLHPLFVGVYAVGVPAQELDPDGWTMAGILRRRGLAATTGATAAAALDIWHRLPPRASIEIVTTGHADVCRPGRFEIVTRRSRRLDVSTIVDAGGIPSTDASRTLLEAGRTHRPLQLASMIDRACYLGLLDIDRFTELVRDSPNLQGSAATRCGLEWYLQGSAGTRGRSEDELVRLVEGAGLPHPLVNVRGATGVLGLELDFVWTEPRLVVELDGGHHRQPGVAQQDAQRDAALRAAGWPVLRFPSMLVWEEPRAIIHAIACALGRA